MNSPTTPIADRAQGSTSVGDLPQDAKAHATVQAPAVAFGEVGAEPGRQRPDSWLDQVVDAATTVGIVVLIVVGFATSYRTLRDLAILQGGYPPWLAPAVPLSFDLGIVVLSLKVIRAARDGRSAPVMRLLVAALSTATVAANASAARTLTAQLLHAVPPAMFVICFESVVVTARRRALTRMGLLPEPLPRLRVARWLLAPRSSWVVWRNLVLYGQLTGTAFATSNPVSPSEPVERTGEDLTLAQHMAKARGARAGARVRTTASKPEQRSSKPYSAQDLDRLRREDLVRDLVRDAPGIAAPALADLLRQPGHSVSVRTAQRLRAQALGGREQTDERIGGVAGENEVVKRVSFS